MPTAALVKVMVVCTVVRSHQELNPIPLSFEANSYTSRLTVRNDYKQDRLGQSERPNPGKYKILRREGNSKEMSILFYAGRFVVSMNEYIYVSVTQ